MSEHAQQSDNSTWTEEHAFDARCKTVREGFDSYLEGTATGVEMATIASHLDDCPACDREFSGLLSTQQALASLGPAKAPEDLQRMLRGAIAVERERGTHLPLLQRISLSWQRQIAATALRITGGLAATVAMLACAVSLLGLSNSVLANDDNMTHLVGPHYLYSQVPQTPVETRQDVPVVVDAKVDLHGRVYDYAIVAGPTDASTTLQVERNLLTSVFRPATLFGVPVKGHVVVTYSGVSVRG